MTLSASPNYVTTYKSNGYSCILCDSISIMSICFSNNRQVILCRGCFRELLISLRSTNLLSIREYGIDMTEG